MHTQTERERKNKNKIERERGGWEGHLREEGGIRQRERGDSDKVNNGRVRERHTQTEIEREKGAELGRQCDIGGAQRKNESKTARAELRCHSSSKSPAMHSREKSAL